MFSLRPRSALHTFALLVMTCSVTLAQTPTPSTPRPTSPQTGPAQRDATRPPGTEQRQPVPPGARPVPTDPTAPPGTERPAPQAPPGTQVTPQSPMPTQTPQVPATTPGTPSTDAGQQVPLTGPTTTVPSEVLPEPNFPVTQPRPVPPLPSLVRLGVTSGETRSLSMNEAIRRALENNNDIEFARNDVRLAESFLRSLQGAYDPVFEIVPQINNSVSPQQSSLGGSDQSGSVTQTDFSVGPSVLRRFETGGGQYEFFFNNNRRTTNSRFNNFTPVYSSNLGVSFTQPLFRDRAIDNTRRNIRIQRKRLEQTDADFRRRTVEVIAQVQRAYWDLVFAMRDEQNQIANLNLARENFRRIEASVVAGALAPLERAEIQTELSNRESSLLLSSQNVSIAENNLKFLILKDPLAPDWSAALVPTDQPAFNSTPVNLTDALTEARANRPEIRRLRLQQDISDIDLVYFKNQTRPRVDIQSTVSTTGLAGTPVANFDPITGNPLPSNIPENLSGGYFRNIRNLFGLDTRNIVVGVAIQIPLRNRTAEANLTTARIEREQLAATTRAQEQSVEVEVRNAAQAVETSRRRVLSAQEARRNAELQLTGEQRLFQVGRSTSFLLFQRENQLVNARNQELRAETDYNKALAELQRSTSTTLRANNVVIETPALP
ncbi:MAG: TolC family protein [Pyrinomonadaceae bacterium]